MADTLNGLFISEVLADNAGNAAIDTDGDGSTNKADEFIELGNVSGGTFSLDGYEVWSEKNGLLYSFGASDVIGDGQTATIVGNYTGAPPSGFYNAGIAENGNFIPDGEGQKFDTIFLVDTNTGDYITLSYGQPPRAPTLPNNFPGSTQVGSGESINSNAPNGTAFARDSNGTFVETTPTPGTPDVACFAEDTMILTKFGEKCVSALRPGDMIPTYDHGNQPLLGICTLHLSPAELLRTPAHRPLTVDRTLFGAQRDIRLSPAHCLLYGSAYGEALFASAQVLVRARHLEAAGLARSAIPPGGVTYYHLLFEDHALVMANGYWSESFLNVDGCDTDAHANAALWEFGTGVTLQTARCRHAARIILRKYEALMLVNAGRARIDATPAPGNVISLSGMQKMQRRVGWEQWRADAPDVDARQFIPV